MKKDKAEENDIRLTEAESAKCEGSNVVSERKNRKAALL